MILVAICSVALILLFRGLDVLIEKRKK